MTLIDNTQLGLERAISGASLRQSVLANNLANAETPGFRRMDVDFHDALAEAMGSADSATIEATTCLRSSHSCGRASSSPARTSSSSRSASATRLP